MRTFIYIFIFKSKTKCLALMKITPTLHRFDRTISVDCASETALTILCVFDVNLMDGFYKFVNLQIDTFQHESIFATIRKLLLL